MRSIHETLREKEMEIKMLLREVEVLRAAAKIVGDEQRRSISHRKNSPVSQPQMIREVIAKHAGPLHVDRIAREIKKRFNTKLKKAEITSVIYREIRGGKSFRKVGVNTFGLFERETNKRPDRNTKQPS